MSIMKLPRKSATLPSLARSLGREGYRSAFMYGGDLNFTNQASFMYSTGWETVSYTHLYKTFQTFFAIFRVLAVGRLYG